MPPALLLKIYYINRVHKTTVLWLSWIWHVFALCLSNSRACILCMVDSWRAGL